MPERLKNNLLVKRAVLEKSEERTFFPEACLFFAAERFIYSLLLYGVVWCFFCNLDVMWM